MVDLDLDGRFSNLTFLLTILTGAFVSIFSVKVNSRRSKVAAAPVPFFSLSLINKPEIMSSSLYVLSSRPNLSSCLSASDTSVFLLQDVSSLNICFASQSRLKYNLPPER